MSVYSHGVGVSCPVSAAWYSCDGVGVSCPVSAAWHFCAAAHLSKAPSGYDLRCLKATLNPNKQTNKKTSGKSKYLLQIPFFSKKSWAHKHTLLVQSALSSKHPPSGMQGEPLCPRGSVQRMQIKSIFNLFLVKIVFA